MPSGLFGSKGKKPKDVKVIVINRFDREDFFRSLREFGWEQIEGPFEFELKWSHERVRKSAREHAAEIDGDILIEIRDKDYSTNPYNDYVFYVWRGTPGVRGIPPPPSYQKSTGFALAQQIQQQQAQARAQHIQAMKSTALQVPIQGPAPKVVSSGGTCPNCKGNQVQYFDNGIARCPQCGSNFKWQMPPSQPPAAQTQAAQSQQLPPRPPPQVQVPQAPAQPAVQPAAKPAQQPKAQAPTQPAAQLAAQAVARPAAQPAAQPTQQPRPQAPAQPQPQPTQQPRPQAPAQPQPQPTQQPRPQAPAQPQPQQAQQPVSYCPKCKIPLKRYPNGRMACLKCGLSNQ
jgi:ribosomal protein L37AE/L43A